MSPQSVSETEHGATAATPRRTMVQKLRNLFGASHTPSAALAAEGYEGSCHSADAASASSAAAAAATATTKQQEQDQAKKSKGFTGMFGQAGAGLVANRGRRVESSAQDRRGSRIDKNANALVAQLTKQVDKIETEEVVVPTGEEAADYQNTIRAADRAKKRLAAEKEAAKAWNFKGNKDFVPKPRHTKGILHKVYSHLTGSDAPPLQHTRKHDDIVRSKLKAAMSDSLLKRRLVGMLLGVDGTVREGDPEWVEKMQQMELKAELAREAAQLAFEAAEREHRKKRKPTRLDRMSRLVFGPPPKKVITLLPGKEPPPERKTAAQKVQEARAEEFAAKREEIKEAAKYRSDIMEQVIEAYAARPPDKRIKFPPHALPAAEDLADYDLHYIVHDNNNTFSENDAAIKGVSELMLQRPDLWDIKEEAECSVAEESEGNNGVDMEKYFKLKHQQHEKEVRQRTREVLGVELASVTNDSATAPRELSGQQRTKIEKVKERKELLKRAYRSGNIPNPWWEGKMCQIIPNKPDLTWQEVQERYGYKNYIPGHFHGYRGENKVFSFPPVADQAGLVEDFSKKKKKKVKNKDGRYDYDLTPGADNNKETNCTDRYTWDPKKNEYTGKDTSFKANNPRLDAYKPPTTDVLDLALYKHRPGVAKEYPQSKLLPSKKDLLADAEKHSAAEAKLYRPLVRFKKASVDLSRTAVRLDSSDPINTAKQMQRLFKRLKAGRLTRIEYDAAVARLNSCGHDEPKKVNLPENYGDYADDAYNSEEDSSSVGSAGAGSLGSGISEDEGAGAGAGLYTPVTSLHASSVAGGGSPSVAFVDTGTGSGSVFGSVTQGSVLTSKTKSSRSSRTTANSPGRHPDEQPVIISNIQAEIIPLHILTTMGAGGKYADRRYKGPQGVVTSKVTAGVLTDRANRGHVVRPIEPPRDPLLASVETPKVDNTLYMNDIDERFNTDKKQLITAAGKDNKALTDAQVRAVGDLYHDETRTMVARRDLLDENSISSARQHVRVKMERHRGVRKLNNKHISMSHHTTHSFCLESARTKEKRATKVKLKNMMKTKLREVNALMADMKAEEDAAAYERERERNRMG